MRRKAGEAQHSLVEILIVSLLEESLAILKSSHVEKWEL